MITLLAEIYHLLVEDTMPEKEYLEFEFGAEQYSVKNHDDPHIEAKRLLCHFSRCEGTPSCTLYALSIRNTETKCHPCPRDPGKRAAPKGLVQPEALFLGS